MISPRRAAEGLRWRGYVSRPRIGCATTWKGLASLDNVAHRTPL
jgi:hypothetical protein